MRNTFQVQQSHTADAVLAKNTTVNQWNLQEFPSLSQKEFEKGEEKHQNKIILGVQFHTITYTFKQNKNENKKTNENTLLVLHFLIECEMLLLFPFSFWYEFQIERKRRRKVGKNAEAKKKRCVLKHRNMMKTEKEKQKNGKRAIESVWLKGKMNEHKIFATTAI